MSEARAKALLFEVRTLPGDGVREVRCARCGAFVRLRVGVKATMKHVGPCLAHRQIETFTGPAGWTVKPEPLPA